ncbi:hypothetical protein BEWA_021210 [Theileria equi strain WA]|uniref:Serine/threonine specific protein phosphatases domain-containing protein n=1 Tax=Theileria equi strain WA TaxID=1537102 RepID=L0AVK0_THEEQ|nr:hypothetical protein BEWA_021210 [Theileria equi strain WA]AFZ79273.1 hypothetical protein BEWA_021210 [Theileria equi strain WA]|eukprot:XP_004828939.1 hypothetical protein BEWA_021210 [Theileria equi strain WA]
MGSASDEKIAVDTIFVNRLDSSEFSSKLVPIHVEGGNEHISGSSKVEFAGSVSASDSATILRAGSKFTKWLSQSLLLKQIEAADKRVGFSNRQSQDSLDFMIPEEIGTDAATEQVDDSANVMSAIVKDSINSVFFANDGSNNPVISHIFDHSEDRPVSTELLSQMESFKEDFLELANKYYDAFLLKKALLTVLFNHYGGNMVDGYMTLKEYLHMITYHDIFSNVTMAKFVFDAMDRKRSSMIVLNDFIAGMLACSPDASDELALAYGKLRLQHIFRAYDLERRGLLDKETLNVMVNHLEHLSSGGRVGTGFSSENELGIQKPIDMHENVSSDLNETGMDYDSFYSQVASGTIKNTKLLLRSKQDLAKSLVGFFQQVLDKPVCTPVKGLAETRLKPVETVTRPSSEPSASMSKLSLWNSFGTPTRSNSTMEKRVLDLENDDTLFTTRTSESNKINNASSNLYNFPGLNMNKAWSRTPTVNIRENTVRSLGMNCFSESEDDIQKDVLNINDSCIYNEQSVSNYDTHADVEIPSVVEEEISLESTREVTDPEPSQHLHTLEKNDFLDEKINELVKNYRHKYLGFSANEVDDTIALKVFKKFYKKMFESGESFSVDIHFDWCTYTDLLKLCDSTCNLLKKEDSLLKLNGSVQIYGSINADIISLGKMFNTYGWPLHQCNNDQSSPMGEPVISIFVGNFTSDTRVFSLEFLTFLFSLKILFPRHVYFLRSGKDNRLYNNKNGFYNEIYNTLSGNVHSLNFPSEESLILQNARELFHRINDVFEFISIAAIISDKVLCLYGTISSELNRVDELFVPKPIVIFSREVSGKIYYYHNNVHVNEALFGSIQDDELVTSLKKAGIKMLISCDENLRSGYEYSHNSTVLRISTKFKDDTVSTLVLVRSDKGEILINHKSIRVNCLQE